MPDATSADIKKLREDISDLSSRMGKLETTLDAIAKELGVREGRLLDDRFDELLQKLDGAKREIGEVRADTIQIRRIQEIGMKDTLEIKRALAAIYRSTDELEKNLISEEPETHA